MRLSLPARSSGLRGPRAARPAPFSHLSLARSLSRPALFIGGGGEEIGTNATSVQGERKPAFPAPETRRPKAYFDLQVRDSGTDTGGLVRKIVDLLNPRPVLRITSRPTLLLTMQAVIDTTAALQQQQDSGGVLCFTPTVERGTLATLLKLGLSQDDAILLRLEKVPARPVQSGGRVHRVARDSEYRSLADAVLVDLLGSSGTATLSTVGSIATEIGFKALLQARTTIMGDGCDIHVIPQMDGKIETTSGIELQVWKLVVFKSRRFKQAEPAQSGSGGQAEPAQSGSGGQAEPAQSGSGGQVEPAQSGSGGSPDSVTISAEKWKAMNSQIEELTSSYSLLAELLKQQPGRSITS